ncbi:MAG: hypothetical protein M1819_005147 [Sarea resinae]|nr:MAG: hypothetical protein M1819_005147 [Sarea resinae]
MSAALGTPPGHFKLLYFASASSFTKRVSEDLEAPLPLSKLFDLLEARYPTMKERVLDGCLVTVNLEYVDIEAENEAGTQDVRKQVVIQEGDEVAIIPPVSSG